MARIPLGEFGYRTPRGGDVTPTAGVDNAATDAAMGVGRVLQGIGAQQFAAADQERRRQEAEAKAAEDRAMHAQVTLAHVNIQNDLADQSDAITRDVLDGKMDKVQALAAWKDGSSKTVAERIKGLPADRAALLSAQAQGLQGKLSNSLFDTFRKRDDQDAVASVTEAEGGLLRMAGKDLAGAIKQHGMLIDGSPLAPDMKAKRKQAFVETATYNGFRAEGQAAYQSGDPAAIEAVRTKLAGASGDAVDPARRNSLDQTMFGWTQSIEARQDRAAQKAEREALRRFNTATDTLNKGRDIVMNGGALAPEYIEQMASDAQGTGLEKDVQALLEVQKSVSGFANLPAAKRASLLESEHAARADPRRGATPESERQLKAAEQIQSNLTKGYETDPWQTAVKTAVIKAAPVVSMADVGSAMSVLQQRMAVIRDVDLAAGFKISPLQPAEAEQLAKLAKTLKPDQAASMLGQMGALVGDAERIAGLAKQMGGDGDATRLAMMYANAQTIMTGDSDRTGRHTAELILLGAQAIKDKAVKVDGAAETGWRSEIAKEIRGAFRTPEVEQQMIDAAFLIRASGAGEATNANAVRLAAGVIIQRNGVKVPLPYGMVEKDFEKRIEAITPATLADQAPGGSVVAGPAKLPLADFVKTLPSARLVHAGPGRYNVRTGNSLVTNEAGQAITLRVGP